MPKNLPGHWRRSDSRLKDLTMRVHVQAMRSDIAERRSLSHSQPFSRICFLICEQHGKTEDSKSYWFFSRPRWSFTYSVELSLWYLHREEKLKWMHNIQCEYYGIHVDHDIAPVIFTDLFGNVHPCPYGLPVLDNECLRNTFLMSSNFLSVNWVCCTNIWNFQIQYLQLRIHSMWGSLYGHVQNVPSIQGQGPMDFCS